MAPVVEGFFVKFSIAQPRRLALDDCVVHCVYFVAFVRYLGSF